MGKHELVAPMCADLRRSILQDIFARESGAEGPAVETETAGVLQSVDYLYALAVRVKELGFSRQKTTDWLADIIYGYDGPIVGPDGSLIDIHAEAVDEAYGDDLSFSWNTDLKRFVDRPPQRRSNRRVLRRLVLFDAAFKIVGKPVWEK